MRHIKNDQNGHYRRIRVFDSLAEKYEFVSERSDTLKDSTLHAWRDDGSSFTGTESMPDALELAATGWNEPRKEVERYAGEVASHVDEVIETGFAWSMDVTGEFVDVPSFLSGEPECMFSVALAPVTKHGNVVTLLYSNCVSGSVSQETMTRRGAVILALCEILKRSGYALEVWTDATTDPNGHAITSLTRVLPASELVDIDRLMFPLAHPSEFRRMDFAVYEKEQGSVRKACKITSHGGYGHVPNGAPDDVLALINPDIIVDGTIRTDESGKGERAISAIDNDPVGWIVGRLQGLGLVK